MEKFFINLMFSFRFYSVFNFLINCMFFFIMYGVGRNFDPYGMLAGKKYAIIKQ